MRGDPGLSEMLILKRGNRLSITPLTESEFSRIGELGRGQVQPRTPTVIASKPKR
jgi:predicted RNA-binding protein with PUA-like domain